MKTEILNQFNGLCCSIDEIVEFVGTLGKSVSRKTVIWAVNDLVRQEKAVRVGRGVYDFAPRDRFTLPLSDGAEKACILLDKKFKYLQFTVTDSYPLGEFMNMLPFSTTVVIETRKSAVDTVVSTLRNEGIEAFVKKDFIRMERYISSYQPFVVRSELSANPNLQIQKNVRIANLEKILVDLVCDEDIFGQYQGEELRNIYRNSTEMFAVNYSQILKYASARQRKAEVMELLDDTREFKKVRNLI